LKDRHAIRPYQVGHEKPIELLIKSGLWANLSPPTQRIVPVLLCFAEGGNEPGTLEVRISYRAIQRYSGVSSFETISTALQQLTELEWLKKLPQANTGTTVLRDVNIYVLTPYSDAVMEMANSMAAAFRAMVEQERELRRQQRSARRYSNQASKGSTASTPTEKTGSALLKSTSLYGERSVGQNGATWSVAESVRPPESAVLRYSVVVRHRVDTPARCAPTGTAKAGSESLLRPACGSSLRPVDAGGVCGGTRS